MLKTLDWLWILVGQEAKNTAALKSQIEKLQQERDEFQRMVIGNQVWLVLDAAWIYYFILVKLYWWIVLHLLFQSLNSKSKLNRSMKWRKRKRITLNYRFCIVSCERDFRLSCLICIIKDFFCFSRRNGWIKYWWRKRKNQSQEWRSWICYRSFPSILIVLPILDDARWTLHLTYYLMYVYRKKGGSVGPGMARRLTLTSTKR